MANRLVGNIFIVDSAEANIALSIPENSYIGEVAFWGADTTGIIELTGASTADVIAKIQIGTNVPSNDSIYVGTRVQTLKCPVVTAGTAWIYLL